MNAKILIAILLVLPAVALVPPTAAAPHLVCPQPPPPSSAPARGPYWAVQSLSTTFGGTCGGEPFTEQVNGAASPCPPAPYTGAAIGAYCGPAVPRGASVRCSWFPALPALVGGGINVFFGWDLNGDGVILSPEPLYSGANANLANGDFGIKLTNDFPGSRLIAYPASAFVNPAQIVYVNCVRA